MSPRAVRSAPRRMGPRPAGGTSTRTLIVRSASRLIARQGLRGVSVRAVARQARVDPALIYRYFRNKEELFVEALRASFHIVEAPEDSGGFRLEGIGEKIAFRFLRTWGAPASAPMLVSLLRAAAEDPRAERQLREFIEETIVPATRVHLGAAAELRAPMVGSLLMGVGVMRYLLHIEPIASMRSEEVAALVGPMITAVLQGAFDPPGPAGAPKGPAEG